VTVQTYPAHLINVATLPCESQSSENVILQWDITKEKIASIVRVRVGGGHFEHMLWNSCSFESRGSSEHFMELSV